GHGWRLGGRSRAVVERPLQRRGLRNLDAERALAAPDLRRSGAARALCLATAGALLDRPHRHPALSRVPVGSAPVAAESWTRERVIGAIRRWHDTRGGAPRQRDWSKRTFDAG